MVLDVTQPCRYRRRLGGQIEALVRGKAFGTLLLGLEHALKRSRTVARRRLRAWSTGSVGSANKVDILRTEGLRSSDTWYRRSHGSGSTGST